MTVRRVDILMLAEIYSLNYNIHIGFAGTYILLVKEVDAKTSGDLVDSR